MAAPTGRTPIGNYPFPIPDDSVNAPRDFEALATAIDGNAAAVIIGEVRQFGLATAPPRWLVCDGAAKEQAAYPELYAAMGGQFNTGGETPTQFRLPAITGRVVVGAGAGAGLTSRALAARWGSEAVTLAITQVPAHNHAGVTGTDSPDHAHSGNTGTESADHSHFPGALGGYICVDGSLTQGSTAPQAGHTPAILANSVSRQTATSGRSASHYHAFNTSGASARHSHSIPSQGGGGAHDNTPPSIALLVCIYAGRV